MGVGRRGIVEPVAGLGALEVVAGCRPPTGGRGRRFWTSGFAFPSRLRATRRTPPGLPVGGVVSEPGAGDAMIDGVEVGRRGRRDVEGR